jgi:hypothetical protein
MRIYRTFYRWDRTENGRKETSKITSHESYEIVE